MREIEKIKAGVGRSYTNFVLCQVHLRSAAHYTLFLGKKWDTVSRSYPTMGHSQQEAKQAVLCKGYVFSSYVRDWGKSKGQPIPQQHSIVSVRDMAHEHESMRGS